MPRDASPNKVLGIVLAGYAAVFFPVAVLVVALSDMARELHSDVGTLTWVLTGPMLAFGVIGPAVGKLGDRIGHRKVFLASVFGSFVFSVLSALAWDALSLVGFRIIGASIGAATGPSSLATINRMFAPEQRVRAIGYWSVISAGSPLLGIVAGGPIIDHFGWRSIFIITAPMCLLAWLFAVLNMPETETNRNQRFDIPGAAVLGFSLTLLLFGVNRGALWGWTHPVVLFGIAQAPFTLRAFVAIERRAADPLIPLRYFRIRGFTVPMIAQSFGMFGYQIGALLSPLYLRNVLGHTTSEVSWLVAVRPLGFAVVGPMAMWFDRRFEERRTIVMGQVILSVSLAMFALASPNDAAVYILLVSMFLAGYGQGMSNPQVSASIANSVDPHDLGVAAATMQLVGQVFAVAAIQAGQTIQATVAESHGPLAGYRMAFSVAAVAALVGSTVALKVRNRSQMASVDAERGAVGDAVSVGEATGHSSFVD
ncbi:MAG: MFS transporter [Acidimicrobiia bacterium]